MKIDSSSTLQRFNLTFLMLLCVILLQGGRGQWQYQFLEKIATHFPHFHLLTPHL